MWCKGGSGEYAFHYFAQSKRVEKGVQSRDSDAYLRRPLTSVSTTGSRSSLPISPASLIVFTVFRCNTPTMSLRVYKHTENTGITDSEFKCRVMWRERGGEGGHFKAISLLSALNLCGMNLQ